MAARLLSAQPAGSVSDSGQCPALHRLLGEHAGERPMRVLDCGPPLAANIEYFTPLAASLSIADLCRDGLPPPLPDDEQRQTAIEAWVSRWADLCPRDPQDVVLCWDLPDLLERDLALAWLASLVDRLQHPGWLHLLLTTRSMVPLSPGCYHLHDEGAFICKRDDTRTRSQEPWTQRELTSIADGVSVWRTVLLRNGMREYLLHCE